MAKLVKVSIAAAHAQDANGRAYGTYLIPEPKAWQERRDAIAGLNKAPRADLGIDPRFTPPQARRKNTISLDRGGEPIVLVMSDDLLAHLRTDRKNLTIFSVEPITDAKVGPGLISKPKPPPPVQRNEDVDDDDLDEDAGPKK